MESGDVSLRVCPSHLGRLPPTRVVGEDELFIERGSPSLAGLCVRAAFANSVREPFANTFVRRSFAVAGGGVTVRAAFVLETRKRC